SSSRTVRTSSPSRTGSSAPTTGSSSKSELRLVRAGYPGPRADADCVPRVDRDDQADERGDLVGIEVRGGRVVGLRGYVVSGEQRDGFGEGQSCPLTLGEERRLTPRRKRVDALLGLSEGARVLRVHVDAVGAAVQLRGS